MKIIGIKKGEGQFFCPWGTHGLGKTQIVRDYAINKGWKFSYIAPAQFEEMGDLHGMPNVIDPDEKISGDEYTVYSSPEIFSSGSITFGIPCKSPISSNCAGAIYENFHPLFIA